MVTNRFLILITFFVLHLEAQAGSGSTPDYLIDCSPFSYVRTPSEKDSTSIKSILEDMVYHMTSVPNNIKTNKDIKLWQKALIAKTARNGIISKYRDFSERMLCDIAATAEKFYPARNTGSDRIGVGSVENFFEMIELILPAFNVSPKKIEKSFRVRRVNSLESFSIPLVNKHVICIVYSNKTQVCIKHSIRQEAAEESNFSAKWRIKNNMTSDTKFVYYTGIGISLPDGKDYNIKCGWGVEPIKNCPDKQVFHFNISKKEQAEINFRVNKKSANRNNMLDFSMAYYIKSR